MNGTYVLFVHVPYEFTLRILEKDVTFKPGYYAYVGSALGGVEKRVGRHFTKEKKLHWHIDHLLLHAKAVDFVAAKTEEKKECAVADGLAKQFPEVRGFGSSDCKCTTHLFYSPDFHALLRGALEVFKGLGIRPEKGIKSG
jgi:Uri superfamily endonuclease